MAEEHVVNYFSGRVVEITRWAAQAVKKSGVALVSEAASAAVQPRTPRAMHVATSPKRTREARSAVHESSFWQRAVAYCVHAGVPSTAPSTLVSAPAPASADVADPSFVPPHARATSEAPRRLASKAGTRRRFIASSCCSESANQNASKMPRIRVVGVDAATSSGRETVSCRCRPR